MNIRLLAFFLLFALPAASPAQAPVPNEAKPFVPQADPRLTVASAAGAGAGGPMQVVVAFFAALEKGDIDGAYSELTKGSKIAERPEELRQLKSKTREAIEAFGTVRGWDLVDSKSVGSRLVRSTYLSLGKVFPLRWRFYFYKPEDTWRLIDLRVDDKLPGIFDEPEDLRPIESK